MIIITGAAGFVGSALVWKLNQEGINDILIIDEFGSDNKWLNLRKRKFSNIINPAALSDVNQEITSARSDKIPIEAIVHLGACTDTTEKDVDYILENNFEFSKSLYELSEWRNIPFIYASSGATYGKRKQFYVDSFDLKPLNPYGWSKHIFDRWMLQKERSIKWYGLKFFNVYGPNEYHKGKMSSMIYQTYQQIKENDSVKLFREGEQERDFVYVKDVVSVIYDIIKNKPKSGIYNVGTGNSWSFNGMAKCVFDAMGKKPNIKYIDMPESIREKYQSYTKADILKLQKNFYKKPFTLLNEGISDYVQNYLMKKDKYL